jgi:hypothetical protein
VEDTAAIVLSFQHDVIFRITGFLGSFHSGILNARKHNVSETGPVSALR